MKKVLMMVAVAFTLMLTACGNSIDSKIDNLEKAVQSGDPEKIMKAAQALQDINEEDLTDAQKERLQKIFF